MKRRRTSGVQVQIATPRRKILSTPSSTSVLRSPGTSTSGSTAQAPQGRVNEDQSSSQSLRAPSLLPAQTSSTPSTGPSRQTAPESAVADLDLDDFSELDSSFRVSLILNRIGQCSRRCLCKGYKSLPRNDGVGKKGIEKGGVGSFRTKWVHLFPPLHAAVTYSCR